MRFDYDSILAHALKTFYLIRWNNNRLIFTLSCCIL